jgi:flagellar basal body-associated protein FliL
MDRPEEQQEPSKGDDYGQGLADLESASGAELESETDERPDLDALSEEETRGDSVPKAAIVPEDATPPKGPTEPERDLEESETDERPDLDALSEGETRGDSVPKATIVPEDATPPKGPTEPERDLEESEPFTEGSAEKEIETTSGHVSLPEAVDKGDGAGAFWWLKKYQKTVGSAVIGLCGLFLVYGLSRLVTCRHGEQQRVPSVQVYWSPVEKSASDTPSFARFLVLLPKTDEAACLLVRISVKPSNRSVYKELDEKRTFLRASIYAVLKKEVGINKGQRISIKTLKPDIMKALNSMLVTGTIDRIYFTEFLVV